MTVSNRGRKPIRLIAAATASLLAVALGVTTIQSASAAPSRREFTATITPAGSTANQAVTPVLTLTNSARSNNDLGSAQVVVPAGFTLVEATGTTPAGWEIRYPASCSSGSPTGCGTSGTTLIEVATPAVQGAQKVAPGQSLTLALSARAPGAPGAYTFNVAAKNSASWSDGQLFTLKSPAPVFTVAAAPATQLAFSAQPPSSVTAGAQFGASVRLLDAVGQPTTGSQQVTLAGNGAALGGTTTVAAVNGVATFSGLSITTAGSFTLGATSGALTPATSTSIAVGAGSASTLSYLQAPQSNLTAGQSVTAQVALLDAYGNQTAATSTVTLTVTGPGTVTPGTASAVNGVATLSSGSLTVAGTYTVSVSGLSSAPAATSLTVNAGDASQLVFNPAPLSTVQAGQPYAVSVDVRDVYGNATNSDAALTVSIGAATTTQSAANGTAAFNLTAPTAVVDGGYYVTATSASLTSPTPAFLTVTPGAPAALFIMSAPSQAAAGSTVSVGVVVRDAFGNQVTDAVDVTLQVGGAASTTLTTTAGAVTLFAPAPTTIGSTSLLVSSAGLPSVTQPLTITAGPAALLEITSVIDNVTGEVFDPIANDLVDIVVEGELFTVTARTLDAFGNVAPVTAATMLTLAQTGGPAGTLSGNLNGTIAAGASTGSIAGATYAPYGNGVVLAVSAPGLIGDTLVLDVQLLGYSKVLSPGVANTVVNPACANATPEQPVCGGLLLPNGAKGRVLLSQGKCRDITTCLGSIDDALLVNGKANLQNTDGSKLYTRAKPATLVLKCDKTLCGGGNNNTFPVTVDLDGDGVGFADAPPCPAKGRVGADQTFCFDTRLSTRDNAGDLIAYIQFVEDIRGSYR